MTTTSPKPFVLVLMPFSEQFDDTYELGIKAACTEAGAYCERIDQQIFTENILQRLYNQIAKADIIIAEMTGRNPNVFYEVGYAHALNKRVILLTKSADDIPFDLKHYPHITYGNKIASLKTMLEPRIRYYVEHPTDSTTAHETNIDIYLDKLSLADNPTIPINANSNKYSIGFQHLIFHIHNLSNKVLTPNSFLVTLNIPNPLDITENSPITSRANLPTNVNQYALSISQSILPDAWVEITIKLRRLNFDYTIAFTDFMNHLISFVYYENTEPLKVPASIRVCTETGPIDFPFALLITSQKFNNE